MELTEDIIKRAEELQNDCHKTVETVISDSINHQDATNVWIFNKLASIELQIEQLQKSKIDNLTQEDVDYIFKPLNNK